MEENVNMSKINMVPLSGFYILNRFKRNILMNVSYGGSFRDITKFNLLTSN